MSDHDEGFSELSAAFLDERDEEPPSTEAVGPRSRRSLLLVALVGAVIGSAVTLGAVALRGDATDQVAVVAKRFASNLMTFDHRTLEADIADIEADSTGRFRQQFAAALGGSITVFRDAIRQAEAVSEGTVLGVVVAGVDGETATVLAAVDQRITNAETTDPRTLRRLLELMLVDTSDGWKVDGVEVLGEDVR